jgi:AraC-like DNA-binding protein
VGLSRSQDLLVFNFVLSGALVAEQDGRSTLLSTGEGAFCDARRPYRLGSDQEFTVACLQLPRSVIEKRVGDVQRLTAVNLCKSGELGPLVFAYLSCLAEGTSALSGANAVKVCHNFSDLLISMLGEMLASDPLPLSEHRSLALMRIKDAVECNLSNPRLTPNLISNEVRLSLRYMNGLLEAEETSLSRYIWSRRLERSAEELRDPRLRHRTISVIALNNGFNDLSHFSKAFRRRYNMSPRAYRGPRSPGRS